MQNSGRLLRNVGKSAKIIQTIKRRYQTVSKPTLPERVATLLQANGICTLAEIVAILYGDNTRGFERTNVRKALVKLAEAEQVTEIPGDETTAPQYVWNFAPDTVPEGKSNAERSALDILRESLAPGLREVVWTTQESGSQITMDDPAGEIEDEPMTFAALIAYGITVKFTVCDVVTRDSAEREIRQRLERIVKSDDNVTFEMGRAKRL